MPEVHWMKFAVALIGIGALLIVGCAIYLASFREKRTAAIATFLLAGGVVGVLGIFWFTIS